MSSTASAHTSSTRQPLTLAHARSLHDAAGRVRSGCFLADGIRLCWCLHRQRWPLAGFLSSRQLLTSRAGRELREAWLGLGIPELRCSANLFRGISTAARSSGLAAIAPQRWLGLEELARRRGLWIACSTVDRPGNLGTLLRSAASLGAQGLLVLDENCDPYAPDVLRASMGGIFSLQLVRASTASLAVFLAAHPHWRAWGAAPEAVADLAAIDLCQPSIILLGNERRGLTTAERACCHGLVGIPMAELGQSLNLGIAGSLIIYEAWRQRQSRFFGLAPSR